MENTVKMNMSQKAAVYARIREIVLGQSDYDADQVEHRETFGTVDGMMTVQVECRVINPDHDYDSGWFWADGFSVGPKGKIS